MFSKRTLSGGTTAVALVAIAAALFFGTVGTAVADPATVIKDDGACGMLGSDADGNAIFGGIGQVTHDVINDNKEILKCKGENITNLSGRGQSFKDFLCGTFSGLTTDSHATVSGSGVGTLTCIVTLP